MRTMHLFAGAGGGLLADLVLGHEPVLAVEKNGYACRVLRKRADEGWFPNLFVWEGDIRLFDPSLWDIRVDCIHAGWPCQDISVAGPGAGIKGKRSGLWSQVVRIAGRLRPRELFLENSPAITSRGLDTVLGDLAGLGYDARWCVLPASAVGAPHLRARWWCLARRADAESGRRRSGLREDEPERIRRPRSGDMDGIVADTERNRWQKRGEQAGWAAGAQVDRLQPGGGADVADSMFSGRGKGRQGGPLRSSERLRQAERKSVPDAEGQGLEERGQAGGQKGEGQEVRTVAFSGPERCGGSWWATEPDVGRVAHGVAARVDRLTSIGNGQVPLQAATAYLILNEGWS